MFGLFLAALLVANLSAGLASGHPQTESVQSFPPVTAIPNVVTLRNHAQSYALYLPTKYSRDRRWPIVYVFDPLARGPLALAQFQHAAVLYGYIVAVSNNLRNGSWQLEFNAAEAMFRDTHSAYQSICIEFSLRVSRAARALLRNLLNSANALRASC